MKDADLLFKALADPLRIRILEFVRRPDADCCSIEDKVCACDIESLLGLSQPTISHHMKLLVQAGLVVPEKAGRFVYYRIDRETFALASRYLAGFTGGGRRVSTTQQKPIHAAKSVN
jgi:ArsR family transcriptional regulator